MPYGVIVKALLGYGSWSHDLLLCWLYSPKSMREPHTSMAAFVLPGSVTAGHVEHFQAIEKRSVNFARSTVHCQWCTRHISVTFFPPMHMAHLYFMHINLALPANISWSRILRPFTCFPASKIILASNFTMAAQISSRLTWEHILKHNYASAVPSNITKLNLNMRWSQSWQENCAVHLAWRNFKLNFGV